MQKQVRKILAEMLHKPEIVRLSLIVGMRYRYDGYVVGLSDQFVLLHTLYPDTMTLRGYTALRVGTVRRCERDTKSLRFLMEALRLSQLPPVPQPAIDLSTMTSLLTTANATFPMITIHSELRDPDVAFIGQGEKITATQLHLKHIDPAANWSGNDAYALKHITRVDFGDGYADALFRVAENRTRSGV